MGLRLGLDTGGTFTDLIGLDETSGNLIVAKTPSTPSDLVKGVADALDVSGAESDAIEFLILGTTTATNALLERRGARVLFLTTQGFEDIPYIQRMNRRFHYSLTWTKPRPLVKHRDCIGVAERVDFRGQVLRPLDAHSLEAVAASVAERLSGTNEHSLALAVCLLFSYVNPEHELRLGEFLRERFPHVPVSLSHQVAPIWREYERGSTTIADAYVKPTVQGFVRSLREHFNSVGMRAPWALMKSNGGNAAPDAAEAQPINLLLSGLSGGVIGGAYFGRAAGARQLITLDMGGTSCDVGLVRDGDIGYATDFEIEWGLPVATPVVDLTTIGAGGGSIAWIDRGGFLRVGPRSAGAEPGPAAYGQGGQEATVTDANLVLGRLNPDYFLGGRLRLNADAAARAVGCLGQRLGLDVPSAAEAIINMANENMANAVRVLSITRGLDPREFSLVAFGGAGPLHAAALARIMGMRQVVVPLHPGLCSAFGALIADLQVNKVRSQHFRSDRIDAATVDQYLRSLTDEALAELQQEGFTGVPETRRSISMRYAGQNYEQEVPVAVGTITDESLREVLGAFERLHEQAYGYSIGGEVIELIRFNVTVIGRTAKPSLTPIERDEHAEPTGEREVYFRETGFLATPVFRRDALSGRTRVDGPLIVEEVDSTVLVPPKHQLLLNDFGIITMQVPA